MSNETTGWIKASKSSGNSGCLEFRAHDGKVELRDSKLGDASPILTYSPHEIDCFLDGRQNGEFVKVLQQAAAGLI